MSVPCQPRQTSANVDGHWLTTDTIIPNVISYGVILMGTPLRGHRMQGVWKNARFSTNILLYLGNDTRDGHSYDRMRIGISTQAFKWYHFQWPWVTCNGALLMTFNDPIPNPYYFYRTMLCTARTMPSQGVCPSVRLSHAGILTKRLYVSSIFFSPSGSHSILHCESKKLDPFSFEHNFCKYCPILTVISLSASQTEIIGPQTHNWISHFTYSLLLHYLEKCNRIHFFRKTVE